MKNADRIVAQAREWAALACALVGMDDADLSTPDDVQDAHAQAVKSCMRAEREYRSSLTEARVKGARWAGVEGACAALGGLLRLWTAAEGRPISKFDAREGDGLRRGFIDCAAGLAVVFSAPNGFATCKSAQYAARKGAQELFDALTREEESLAQSGR